MASNPADAKGLLQSAIEDDDPVILIENIMSYRLTGPAPVAGYRVPLGKAAIAREGNDVTLISYGRAVVDALAVADQLAGEGISVEVVDLRTIAPFDEATTFASVAKTRRAVVVHEAVRAYGTGAEISSRLHEELFDSLHAPVVRVGSSYSPVPFSPPLEKAWMYNQGQIAAAIRATIDRTRRGRPRRVTLETKGTPMADIMIPKLGMSMVDATLAEWLVADGAGRRGRSGPVCDRNRQERAGDSVAGRRPPRNHRPARRGLSGRTTDRAYRVGGRRVPQSRAIGCDRPAVAARDRPQRLRHGPRWFASPPCWTR